MADRTRGGRKTMATESSLKDKAVLIITAKGCCLKRWQKNWICVLVHKAQDYKTALQYLASYNYDIVTHLNFVYRN